MPALLKVIVHANNEAFATRHTTDLLQHTNFNFGLVVICRLAFYDLDGVELLVVQAQAADDLSESTLPQQLHNLVPKGEKIRRKTSLTYSTIKPT